MVHVPLDTRDGVEDGIGVCAEGRDGRGFGLHLLRLLNGGRETPATDFLPIAHDLPIAVYMTDTEGRVVYSNAAASELWGSAPEHGDLRWCGFVRLYHPDGAPLDHGQSAMAQAVRSDRPGEGAELLGERADGVRLAIIPHSTSITDKQGRIIGGVHLLLDVTERNRSREDTHRLAAIVESSDDAIISKRLDGTITSWNRAAERLFGYSADEIIGKSVLMLIPDDRRDEEVLIIERLRRGERVEHFETVRRHKTGLLLDISLTISPVRRSDGYIIGASKIARDITQRKQAEALLQKQAERLEAVNRVSRIISQDLDLDRIVQAVTDEATALSGARFGAFFYNVIDAEGETYLLYALSGVPREAFERFGMPRNTAVFGPTFAGKGIVRSADIRKDPRYGHNAPHRGMPPGHLPVVSYLAVPVVSASGDVIGGLFFGHDEPDRFGPESETLISAIAAQAAVAIDNARLHQAARFEIARRREVQEAKDLLLHEIKHRVKNTLATVQALASQTLKGTPDAERQAFIKRLHAHSRAHDLLTQSEWQDIGITSLVMLSLGPFAEEDSERIELQGPEMALSANRALMLTMVLHELATNAVKYGALSNEHGRIAIDWRRETGDPATLHLTWRESGGPPVTPPERQGFGSRMIGAALRGSDGHVELDYRREGLEVRMAVVLTS